MKILARITLVKSGRSLVDGSNEKGKSDTAPEDVLEPLEPFDKPYSVSDETLVRKSLRILETETGELYINPDAQHIGSMQSSSDLLRIYSREIQALRTVVNLLMGVCATLPGNLPENGLTPTQERCYNRVIKYLENASWELTLINDPRV